MLRSYRNIFIAIGLGVACLAIATGAERAAIWADSPRTYPEYRETAEDAQKRLPMLSVSDALKAAKEQQPCRYQQGYNASDLCAQWRAADAAERASRWGWWQLFLSFFGVVGLATTLWFNLEAWRQAKGSQRDTEAALSHAETSSMAMAKVATVLGDQLGLLGQTVETNKQIAETQSRVFTMQMRAYVSAIDGGAIVQIENELPFVARVRLLNSGSTAAKNLRFWITAGVLPFPLPQGFVFPDAPLGGENGYIPPHQDRSIGHIISDRFGQDVVFNIMIREGMSLYAWGRVAYDDEFGIERQTHFGLSYFWFKPPNGDWVGDVEYIAGMNYAT